MAGRVSRFAMLALVVVVAAVAAIVGLHIGADASVRQVDRAALIPAMRCKRAADGVTPVCWELTPRLPGVKRAG
jgi:hypothetical protein